MGYSVRRVSNAQKVLLNVHNHERNGWYRCQMNAFWIKVVAIAAMVIDHYALLFYPDSFVLTVIGRLAFPLIAWLIANGAVHTHNIDKYLLRLGIFALIAQIPVEIAHYINGEFTLFLNVLFTLFLGLLAIRILKTQGLPRGIAWPAVIACIALGYVLNTDFASGGVLMIVAFYLTYGHAHAMILSQLFIMMILTKLSFFIAPGFGAPFYMHPMEQYGILALPLILLYNGKRGYATGLAFYWFFVIQSFAILLFTLYR